MRVSRDDVQAAATRRRRDRLPRSGAGAGAGASSAGAAGEQKFYAEKLKPAERQRYERALRIEGLEEEIALLRLRIADHVQEPKVLKELAALLVRAVATQHRLSQQHQDDLYQSVLSVIQGIGEAAGLTPPSET